MKRSQLPHVYEEWIRSIEAKETNRTFAQLMQTVGIVELNTD